MGEEEQEQEDEEEQGQEEEEDEEDEEEETNMAMTESTSERAAANRESWVLREGLKQVYNDHIKPLEEYCLFGEWQSKPLTTSDFDANPSVLVLGQYSVGKTSSLRYILGKEFPSMRI